jgi:DNA-binding transcriptional LysR family regulator
MSPRGPRSARPRGRYPGFPLVAPACRCAHAGYSLNGHGIGIAQMWQVRELIQSRRLRVILEDFEIDPLPVHLVRASHKQMPQRMCQFIDFLGPRIKASLG